MVGPGPVGLDRGLLVGVEPGVSRQAETRLTGARPTAEVSGVRRMAGWVELIRSFLARTEFAPSLLAEGRLMSEA